MNQHKWRIELERVEGDYVSLGLSPDQDLKELRGIAEMEEQLERLWKRLDAAEQSGIDIDRRARGVKKSKK